MNRLNIKKTKFLLGGARVLSLICNPLVIPFLGFVMLLTFSYLSILPASYKFTLLSMVLSFTLLIPLVSIWVYRKLDKQRMYDLNIKANRVMPYCLIIFSYLSCLFTMSRMNIPPCLSGVIVSSLVSIVICALVNMFWKISVHMAGMGQLIGGIISFSVIFYYNPVWWLCLFILLAGAEGTSSIIVRQHTLSQVLVGGAVGLGCGILGILFIH
ncbi:MAG: hypothetical protein IJ467_04620 [Bacteroidaceae bacterium]|nr:hypothetical protein [Bacteroidaceae bacterium]